MDYLEQNQTSNLSINDPAPPEHYQRFYEIMREITGIYLFPVISTFGILGNIFIIIVYGKSKINSTNLYLISLAVSDILKLLNDFTYFLVMFIHKFNTKLGDSTFYFLYNYTHYIFVFTALTNSWLMCNIAIDRFITVVKQKQINQTRVVISITSIILISIICAIPAPLFSKTVNRINPATNESYSEMVETDLGKSSFKTYYQFFSGMMRTIVPVTLLIYFNMRILKVVYANRMKSKSRNRKGKSNSRITLMLLTILGTFIFCVFPDSCMTMMHMGYANEDYFVRGLREITDLLMALNSAANFPICLYFSIEFRIKFRQIFMSSFASKQAASNSKALIANVTTANRTRERIPILLVEREPNLVKNNKGDVPQMEDISPAN